MRSGYLFLRGDKSDFSLLFGIHDIRVPSGHSITRKPALIITKNPKIASHDILMIMLEKEVCFDTYIQPICLPFGDNLRKPLDEKSCETTGFGLTGSIYSIKLVSELKRIQYLFKICVQSTCCLQISCEETLLISWFTTLVK